MPLQNFSDADMALLRRVIDREQRRPENRNFQIQEDQAQAPEVYVVLPPTGGIPSLNRIGTGDTPLEGDAPGYADCTLYTIVNDVMMSLDVTIRVFNITQTDIPEDWTLVEKTKQGSWIAVGAGGTDVVTPGTGTGTDCQVLTGVDWNDVTIVSSLAGVDYVIGISGNCLVLVPLAECTGT